MRDIRFRAFDGIRMTTSGIMFNSTNGLLEVPTGSKMKLMQYTGLKDKNGVDIYEGDIVKVPETQYHTEFNIDIVYRLGMFMGNSFLFSEELYQISNKLEVIGNIYENKELINA